jgi:hypothetical protein
VGYYYAATYYLNELVSQRFLTGEAAQRQLNQLLNQMQASNGPLAKHGGFVHSSRGYSFGNEPSGVAHRVRGGFSGDRADAAGPVVESLIARGGSRVLIFETLAERTLALAQLARRGDPGRRIRAAARRAARARSCAMPGAQHPHREQLRRGQSARRGAAHPRARARARRARSAHRDRGGDDLSGAIAPRDAAREIGERLDASTW